MNPHARPCLEQMPKEILAFALNKSSHCPKNFNTLSREAGMVP